MFEALSLHILSDFHFLRPWWGLSIVPLIAMLLFYRDRHNQSKKWEGIIAPHILRRLVVDHGGQGVITPIRLVVCLMLVVVIILMGPSWSRQVSPLVEDNSALVVVLDVSPSMMAEDIQPTRMTRAKQKISDLLEIRKGSQASLVVYAGSAHVALPLTNDIDIFRTYLDAISVNVMPKKGKFVERTIPLLGGLLNDPTMPGTVLLLTDGLGQNSIEAFSKFFKESPFQLLVLGVGKTIDEIHALGLDGIAEIDKEALKKLAAESNGQYIELSIDDNDIETINRSIEAYYIQMEDSHAPWIDQGYYLLFLAVLLLLPWFRKGWSINWVLVMALSGSFLAPDKVYASGRFIDLWLTPDQQGRWYFSQQNYVTAAERFEDPLWKGVSFYLAEEFSLAAEYFSRIDSKESLFNLANTLAHDRNYFLARSLYKKVLVENPQHQAALHNLARIEVIIEDIERMSESQKTEQSEPSGEMSIAPDTEEKLPEEKFAQEQTVETFSAEELLQSEELNQMWMQSVQKDPSEFLANKFARQLAEEP